MCPRFPFVDTNNCAHKGHHPHSNTLSTHGRNRTLTFEPEPYAMRLTRGCGASTGKVKNISLWASKTGNSGHAESVTCDRARRGVFGQPVPRASALHLRNFPEQDSWPVSPGSYRLAARDASDWR